MLQTSSSQNRPHTYTPYIYIYEHHRITHSPTIYELQGIIEEGKSGFTPKTERKQSHEGLFIDNERKRGEI